MVKYTKGDYMARIEINFLSKILNRTTDISLILPSYNFGNDFKSKNPDKYYQEFYENKLPLLILLHGFGGDHTSWLFFTKVEMYAEEHNIAVVMINGENNYYLNNQIGKFYDFIETELKDYLYGTFPISSKRDDNFIAGLSMGGYGALYHGFSNPQAYKAIGAFSPAIKPANLTKSGIIVESVSLRKLIISHKKELPDIYLSIGSEDSLLPQNLKFVKYLEDSHIASTSKVVPGYGHEWRLWDIELENFLKFIDK